MKIYTTVKPKVVGMYLTNGRTLDHFGNNNSWYCTEDTPFLPILRYVSISPSNQVTLASTKSVKHDIDTYNSNFTLERYSKDVLDNNKTDISTNGLILGPIVFVLNFTGTPLTITSYSGIAQTFEPLSLKSIPETEGKLLIMTLHLLNTPKSVESRYGINNNYLSEKRDKIATRKDAGATEIKEIYDYVIKALTKSSHQATSIISDTYKVVTMVSVDVNKHLDDKINKDLGLSVLCLSNLRMEITREGIVEAPLHDSLTENFATDSKAMATIREHGYSCFIVDNKKKLSPRFFNFAGVTQQVPTLQDSFRQDGFYLMHIDAKKVVEPIVFKPLDEIDSLKYIYDNQETAEKGANAIELRKEEVEQLRTERTVTSLSETAEHSKLMQEMNRQHLEKMNALAEEKTRNELAASRERAQFELNAIKAKAESDEAIQKLKAQLESKKQETDLFKFQFDQGRYKMDYNTMHMKQNYEEGKYERDTTIETIKTAGAVAGLLAGTYVLFNKFK